MKYHHQTLQQKKAAEQARQRAVGSNETAAGGAKDTLQVQHMKQLTKVRGAKRASDTRKRGLTFRVASTWPAIV